MNVSRLPASRSTVARKIGAKMAPRLRTRCHEGGCGVPRPGFDFASPFAVLAFVVLFD